MDYLFLRQDLQDEQDTCSYVQEDLQGRNIFSHYLRVPIFLLPLIPSIMSQVFRPFQNPGFLFW